MTVRMNVAFALLAMFFAAGGATAKPAQTHQSQDEISQQRIEAMEAIQAVDSGRILADKAYAEMMLRSFDLAEPLVKDDRLGLLTLNTLKIIALFGAGKLDEADALSRRSLAANPDQPAAYRGRFFIALARQNASDALAALEAANRNVKGQARRKELADIPTVDAVIGMKRSFYARKDEESPKRLAEALLDLKWDAGGDAGWVDSLRMQVLENRLERGDTVAAKALADAIDTPEAVLTLLTMRKYDALVQPSVNRNQRFQAALDLEAARTLRDLSDYPDDDDVMLRRIFHLYSIGKDEEILELTASLASDMELVAARGNTAFWLIDKRVNALRHLGRSDEAVSLMEKLIGLDYSEYPELINMSINHGILLGRAGRYAAAFAHAKDLSEKAGSYASSYGHRWIWSAAACALAAQGKAAAAESWLAKLREKSDENYWAFSQALLCLDKLDEAELLMVKKLGEDDPSDVVGMFHTYRENGAPDLEFDERIGDHWDALIARPSVKAAFDKVGRALTLPIVISY